MSYSNSTASRQRRRSRSRIRLRHEQQDTASEQARPRYRSNGATLSPSLPDCESTSLSILNTIENNISEPDITQTALSQQGFVVHSVLHASNIARLMTQSTPVTPIFVPARPPSPTSYHYGSIHLLTTSTDHASIPPFQFEDYLNGSFSNQSKGVSDQYFALLPIRDYSGDEVSSPVTSQTAGECPACHICFEQFKLSQEITTMPCFHIFHTGCIYKWLRLQRSCPMCRTDVIDFITKDLEKPRKNE